MYNVEDVHVGCCAYTHCISMSILSIAVYLSMFSVCGEEEMKIMNWLSCSSFSLMLAIYTHMLQCW